MANGELFSLMQEYLGRINRTNVSVGSKKGPLTFNPMFGAINVFFSRNSEIDVINGGTHFRGLPRNYDVNGRVEIRMGDYEDGSSEAHTIFVFPNKFRKDVAEIILRRSANETMWDSIDDYLRRTKNTLGLDNEWNAFTHFSKEEPVQFYQDRHLSRPKLHDIEKVMEEVTKSLRTDGITGCSAILSLNEDQRYFANTEGTAIFTKGYEWTLALNVYGIDKDHRVLSNNHGFYGKNTRDFPSIESLLETGRRLSEELNEMKSAPIEKNGTYPAILDHFNHGVIWHEVVGHSLEGTSMRENCDESEVANLFTDRLNEKVAPEFITVYDDPTRTDLTGGYLFDDEGVPAQKVTIIEDGVFKNPLHTRESAGYFKIKSNGHARAENTNVPVSRMSNIVVKSSKEVSYDELKENLIEECKRQDKPYGLIMEGEVGGLVRPSEAVFNTYPPHIFRVYTDGRVERSRGIYIVGTPAMLLDNMIMTSDRYGSNGGYCGAESGSVTTSEIAPDVLLSSVEVNRIPSEGYQLLRENILAK
jgi:TldD protein